MCDTEDKRYPDDMNDKKISQANMQVHADQYWYPGFI
jgi:hypothetical protein